MDLGNSKLLANGGVGSAGGIIDIKMNIPDGDLRVGSLISGSDIRFRNTGNLTINLTDTLASDKVTFSSPGNIIVQDLPGSKSGAITGLVNAKNIDSPAAPHVGSFKLTLEKDNSVVSVGHVDSSGPIELNVSGRVELSQDIVSKSSHITVFARDRVVVGGKVTTQASGQDVGIYSKQIEFTDLGRIDSQHDVKLKGADFSGGTLVSALNLIGPSSLPTTPTISAKGAIIMDASASHPAFEDLILGGNLRLSAPNVNVGEDIGFDRLLMLPASLLISDQRLTIEFRSPGQEGSHLIANGTAEIRASNLQINSDATYGLSLSGVRLQGNSSLQIRSERTGLSLTNIELVSGLNIYLLGGPTPGVHTIVPPSGLTVAGGGTVQFMDGGQIQVSGTQNALYAAPNRSVTVDPGSLQITFGGNTNVVADTADLRPIGFVENSFANRKNLLFHSCQDKTEMWTNEPGLLDQRWGNNELQTGEFLVLARDDIKLYCGQHSVVLRRGALISLYHDAGILKIRNLLEKTSSDVQLQMRLSQNPIIVRPGEEVVVARDRTSLQDGVARRAASWSADHLIAEYSLVSLIDSSTLLTTFLSQKGNVERGLAKDVLKMAACLSVIRRDKGAFSKLR